MNITPFARRGRPPAPAARPARRTRRLLAAVAGLALASAALTAGLAGPAVAASGGSSGSTLRIQAQTSFSTFNPFTAYFDGDLEVIGEIYPTLTAINAAGRGRARTWPTKWTTSADQLTWTFTIKSGLKWSDGKPITAADAAWTLNLIMHNSVAGHRERLAGGELRHRDRAERHDAGHHHQAAAGEHALRTSEPDPDRAAAHLGQRGRRPQQLQEPDLPGRRLRPVAADRLRDEPVRDADGEQGLLPGRAEVRHADRAVLQQQRRDGGGAAQRRARRGRVRSDRAAVQLAEARQGYHRLPAGLQRLDRDRAQPRREDQVRPGLRQRQPGPARPARAGRDRAGAQQAGAGHQGLGRARRRRRGLPAARLPAVRLEAAGRRRRSATTRPRPTRC